ncbi:MAG TPA: DoxX family protein [Pseudonocardiaceae bacterium]|nr:DoxX family protein [Pseudonocardiaceae bacterium]
MNLILWIVAAILAAAFLGSGLMKVIQPKAKLAASGMGWADDFSDGSVKAIGALEILAAIGLILPAVLGIAPVLVPLAALGLVLIMIGAVYVHGRRKEFPVVAFNVILLLLAALVVWGRFGPYAFSS